MVKVRVGVWVTVRVRVSVRVRIICERPGIELGLKVFVTSRRYRQTNTAH